MDCPDTIEQARSQAKEFVWGKGAATSLFQPVSVTVCQYDAKASEDYATVSTKHQQAGRGPVRPGERSEASRQAGLCTKSSARRTCCGSPTTTVASSPTPRRPSAAAAWWRRPWKARASPANCPRHVSPELIKSLGLRDPVPDAPPKPSGPGSPAPAARVPPGSTRKAGSGTARCWKLQRGLTTDPAAVCAAARLHRVPRRPRGTRRTRRIRRTRRSALVPASQVLPVRRSAYHSAWMIRRWTWP